MILTLRSAKALTHNDYLHFPREGNRNGCERWKVNGNVQTWKRNASRVRVPIKRGLYSYDAITEADFDSVGNAIGQMRFLRIVNATHPCDVCGLTW